MLIFRDRVLWNLGTPLGTFFQRAPPNEPTYNSLKALLFRQTMTTITCIRHA